MRKILAIALLCALVLTLAACGQDSEKTDNKRDDTVSHQETADETLSPRDQFKEQQAAMDELLNRNDQDDQSQQVTPCSFTAGGFTLNLDSSFVADYSQTEGLVTYWHKNGDSFSYTMKIGISPVSNYAGYTSSQEAAEDIASQKPDVRTVGSANGVYYVLQQDSLTVIKAYYVDDSGMYWVIDGMTSSSVDFEDYKDQLIRFCTSGNIH